MTEERNVARTFRMDTTVDPLSLLARPIGWQRTRAQPWLVVRNRGASRTKCSKGEYRTVGQTLIVTIIGKHWLLA